MHVQFHVMGSKDKAASDAARGVSEAMALACFDLLKRTEAVEPATPLPDRTSLVTCQGRGCEVVVKVSTSTLWRHRRDGRSGPGRYCLKCIEGGPARDDLHGGGPGGLMVDKASLAQSLVESITRLESKVLAADDSPEHSAYFALGKLDRDAARMLADVSRLVSLLGREAAWSQIDSARERMGTAGISSQWEEVPLEAAVETEPELAPSELHPPLPGEATPSRLPVSQAGTEDGDDWIF